MQFRIILKLIQFGSIEDFRSLVKTIQDNDMFVILDWVPNHINKYNWITNHSDFYTKNEQGEIIHLKGQIGLMWPT